MPKLYTKTGDEGLTSLFDGSKIHKHEIFFEVLGNIDELSSTIGLICSCTTEPRVVLLLRTIQCKLIHIGSNIATVDEKRKKRVVKISEHDVKFIEDHIDVYDSKNTKLVDFILPGVNQSDSYCHLTRSVARRLERSLWKLHNISDSCYVKNKKSINLNCVKVDKNILKYVNRLSDLFFALARYLSSDDIKVSDIII
jgi:cob(I)alamin adenosyltransferase